MPSLRKVIWIIPTVAILGSATAAASSIHFHEGDPQIEAAHITLYEREVQLRDQNPAQFDQQHPLLGQMLSNEAVYESLLQKLESHPARFEHRHPFLWRILDGDRLYHERYPFETGISHSAVNILSRDDFGQENSGTLGNHGVSGANGGPSGTSVPEPSAGFLMLSALAACLLGAASQRVVNRLVRLE